MLKIHDFTKQEIDYFIRECNFMPEELKVFLLRSKNKSNTEIALETHVSESKVSKTVAKIKKKVFKVIV